VVLVTVGQDHAVNRPAGLEIGQIGNDDIDAEMLFAGEHHAGVDHDAVVAPAVDHQVHPELAETAESHELQLGRVGQAFLAPPGREGTGSCDQRREL